MGYEHKTWLIGVDEAGRGPLAGPVAVGLVKVPIAFNWRLIEGVGDSKSISPKQRAVILGQAEILRKEGLLDFVVVLKSAKQIDEKGIAAVIRDSVQEGLALLHAKSEDCFVKLDGALRAPANYDQETIIKGDSKELVIGLASICAKETRDRYMEDIASQFPLYEFAVHKGYGTRTHRAAIAQNGLSKEHRVSYCQNRHLWGKV